MSSDFDIEVARNATWRRQWLITDDDGQPIDLTGATFSADVKAVAGTGAVLGSLGITIDDALGGVLIVEIDGSDFSAVPSVTEITRLAYDILATQDGVPIRLAAGQVILLPGVS